MSQFQSQKDGCFIVVKALPHRSSKHFETVCCAGVGRDLKWRRQYPVPYRLLQDDQKFGRWNWIDYEFTRPKNDPRFESQRVVPESIEIKAKIKPKEQVNILNQLVRESLAEATQNKESLALIRPRNIEMKSFKKTDGAIAEEARHHKELSRQQSMFDPEIRDYIPCPYRFRLSWEENSNRIRHHTCDDWETSTAYFNFKRKYGEQQALKLISDIYQEYFEKGLALAFSTHSRRNQFYGTSDQWLLVGMIRLDRSSQAQLF